MSTHADPVGPLSPVARMLCACALPVDDPAGSARLRDISPDSIDWGAVPPLLTRHGLVVLAASHLAAIRERIPAPVWANVQSAALRARASALEMSGELLRLLRSLAAAGIDALPFKGPLLGVQAYGDLAVRPFVDLDLLVRPRDLEAAVAVLAALGYEPQYRFTPARDRWFRQVDGDYPLVHSDTQLLVELHVRAVSRRFGSGIPTDELWTRRQQLEVSGTTVAVLGNDDLLYLYIVHGAKHRWERLEWIASTAALLRRRGGEVSTLLRPPYVNVRAVLLGCLLARDLLGAPVDAATQSAIAADPVVGRLAATARQRLFDRGAEDDRDDTAAKLGFNLRLQRGLVARTRYLYRWSMWPSPEDWAAVRLPDSLFTLYRLVRPLRLAWRYALPGADDSAAAHG